MSEILPLIAILLGPPGAGKGTLAGPLSETAHLPHISTGDLFREHMRGETALGKAVKSYMDQGKLVPDEIVFKMIYERLARKDCKGGCILDGFPRTLAQAGEFDLYAKGKYRLAAIHLRIADSFLAERITGRLSCKGCGRPFHKTYEPPVREGVCDGCGGVLYQRKDDTEAVLLKRLAIYHAETRPLIAFYAKKPDVLREIDGDMPKEQVLQEVLSGLPLLPEEILFGR